MRKRAAQVGRRPKQLPHCGKEEGARIFVPRILDIKRLPKVREGSYPRRADLLGDQTPCKEYDMEELVNAFEGCNKIKVTRENTKKNKDSQNDPEKVDRSMSKPLTIFQEAFNGRVSENFEKRGYSSRTGTVDFTYKSKWESRLSTEYGVRFRTCLETRKTGRKARLWCLLETKKESLATARGPVT